MLKRLFDLVISSLLLILLSPLFIVIALLIKSDSKGPVLFLQQRVGRKNRDFSIFKFRTMYVDSDKQGLITIGNRDARVTRTGYNLRRYKLDEIPQLINVMIGNMSLVGPRPEVRKYVSLYNNDQMQVLNVKPGITDYASIDYVNENELLSLATDPEKKYVEEIMQAKLQLNLKYIREQNFITDLKILFRTLQRIIVR